MSEIIASVSGVRGILGESLTPENIIRFTSAFAKYCKEKSKETKIAVGWDGRLYGDVVTGFVFDTLFLSGIEVVYLGVAPTPTVQLATELSKAAGGISVTASHNPQQWNGLKFLKSDGTFLDDSEIKEVIKSADENKFSYPPIQELKSITSDNSWIDKHIEKVLKLKILDLKKIKKRKFKVVVDAVNSSGSVIVPKLLKKLNCKVIELYCDRSGKFPHTPEPLPENLTALSKSVKKNKADLGISVDPDADRLVLITDKGKPFGEENTITTAVRFVLKNSKEKNKSAAVNLSTTRSVDEVCSSSKSKIFRSPVGEINVVKEMKKNKCIIGGEGSGGVIYPELHYGRDSLAGIVLVMSELAEFGGKLSKYKKTLPEFFISKTKIDKISNPENVIERIKVKYSNHNDVTGIRSEDGLKIDFTNHWVHLRKSNTEPIIRIIAEAKSMNEAQEITKKFMNEISELN